MALVLNLELGEAVSFGNGIIIRFSSKGTQIRLSIEAPKDIKIERLGRDLDIKRRQNEEEKRR